MTDHEAVMQMRKGNWGKWSDEYEAKLVLEEETKPVSWAWSHPSLQELRPQSQILILKIRAEAPIAAVHGVRTKGKQTPQNLF